MNVKRFDIRNFEALNRRMQKAGCYNRPKLSIFERIKRALKAMFTSRWE